MSECKEAGPTGVNIGLKWLTDRHRQQEIMVLGVKVGLHHRSVIISDMASIFGLGWQNAESQIGRDTIDYEGMGHCDARKRREKCFCAFVHPFKIHSACNIGI